MPRKMKPTLKSYTDDLLERLRDPEYAAAYLNAVLTDPDQKNVQKRFLIALKDVAKAHGMTATADETTLNRQHLYKILSKDGNPEFQTLQTILQALGLRLSIGVNH